MHPCIDLCQLSCFGSNSQEKGASDCIRFAHSETERTESHAKLRAVHCRPLRVAMTVTLVPTSSARAWSPASATENKSLRYLRRCSLYNIGLMFLVVTEQVRRVVLVLHSHKPLVIRPAGGLDALRSFVCLQTDLVGIVAASGAGTHHLRQLASTGTLASSAVQPARQAAPLAEGVAMVERCCCSANPFAALLSLSATPYLRYAVSKLKPYRSQSGVSDQAHYPNSVGEYPATFKESIHELLSRHAERKS
jgi:hypothetical protein